MCFKDIAIELFIYLYIKSFFFYYLSQGKTYMITQGPLGVLKKYNANCAQKRRKENNKQ